MRAVRWTMWVVFAAFFFFLGGLIHPSQLQSPGLSEVWSEIHPQWDVTNAVPGDHERAWLIWGTSKPSLEIEDLDIANQSRLRGSAQGHISIQFAHYREGAVPEEPLYISKVSLEKPRKPTPILVTDTDGRNWRITVKRKEQGPPIYELDLKQLP
jgi:hypothetical protein